MEEPWFPFDVHHCVVWCVVFGWGFLENFVWCCRAEDFVRPVVGLGDVFVEFRVRELSEAGAVREVAADATVLLLICDPLVGRIWVSEIGRDVDGVSELAVVRELAAVVSCHRSFGVCGNGGKDCQLLGACTGEGLRSRRCCTAAENPGNSPPPYTLSTP